MIHRATPAFWECHRSLPQVIRELANKSFELLKTDPRHPALQFEKAGRFWSARVGLYHRALGFDIPRGVLWFWIGPTLNTTACCGEVAAEDSLLGRRRRAECLRIATA